MFLFMRRRISENRKDYNMDKNDVLKQLNELLKQQGMEKESQNFMELFQYMDGMQRQLKMITDELQGVRQQLSQLQQQNQPYQPKSKALVLENKIMDKVSYIHDKPVNLSEKLIGIENHLLKTVTQAIDTYKNKGIAAMSRILQKGMSEVKSMLYDFKENLINEVKSCEMAINQMDNIGNELKQIGNSASNVGRLMSGKGTKEMSGEKTGVALTRLINEPIKNMVESFKEVILLIEKAIEKLEQLTEKFSAIEKSTRGSVKEKLANNKAYIESGDNSALAAVKEKAQPEVAL